MKGATSWPGSDVHYPLDLLWAGTIVLQTWRHSLLQMITASETSPVAGAQLPKAESKSSLCPDQAPAHWPQYILSKSAHTVLCRLIAQGKQALESSAGLCTRAGAKEHWVKWRWSWKLFWQVNVTFPWTGRRVCELSERASPLLGPSFCLPL